MVDRIIEEEELVVLVDDDGGEHEFYLIDTIEVGEGRYAVLLPAEEDDEEESEVIILKIGEDEEGNEVFYEIEDDEEWEQVADAWEEVDKDEGNIELAEEELQKIVPVTVTEEIANTNCPYCRTPLKPGGKAVSCPSCKTLHHEECWRESRGCAHSECDK
ncbi:MAG: DUF1292 domain-containing protein [Bacillota bacterium]|jgi:LSD1 subclass zinc finger protein